jgi:23S rRNA pseudouridine955/2504/2580 synthase/23S rRNA pseudouridine1911/1915/1917 synthase
MDERGTPTRTITVAGDGEGYGVAGYLAARFTYQSEAEWMDHIRTGRIAHNDGPCAETAVLRKGDRIAFTPEPYEEPPVNASFTILREDAEYLFIDKPPLLPCHPGGIYLKNTLVSLLAGAYGTVHLINRLDRETSGIVLAAKTKEAAARAGELMRSRMIEKEYLVLVEGAFPDRIDASGVLVPDVASPIRKKLRFIQSPRESHEDNGGAGDTPGGAAEEGIAARTIFTGKGTFAPGVSLVHARLLTGRTHQIRATLQSLGFPVVGDKLYGKDPTAFLRFIDGTLTESDRRTLRLENQALHCARVSFAIPGGASYDVSSNPPASWQNARLL